MKRPPEGVTGPVLRIRKGVEVYDDTRSESELPAGRARLPTRPSRPPSRRLRLGIFSLLILAVALLAIVRLMPRAPTDRARILGWDVVLRATAYSDALLVSATFVQAAEGRIGAEASVRVLLPDTGDRLSLSGALARSPITLRGQLPYTTRVRRVEAEVTVGTETKTLLLTAPR